MVGVCVRKLGGAGGEEEEEEEVEMVDVDCAELRRRRKGMLGGGRVGRGLWGTCWMVG